MRLVAIIWEHQSQVSIINLAHFLKVVIHYFIVLTDPKIPGDLIYKNVRYCSICLVNFHVASKCTSNYSCEKCEGRHCISICTKDFKNDCQNNKKWKIVKAVKFKTNIKRIIKQRNNVSINNNNNNVLL